jgi:hypothetical protein
MSRFYLAAIIPFLLACERRVDFTFPSEKVNWVEGTITSAKDIDTIFYHDCYCHLVDSTIVVHHVYLRGLHGGYLITTSSKDSVSFEFAYYPYYLKTFSYKFKKFMLNNTNPQLGDTISGRLGLSGEATSKNKQIYKFSLKGNFKCVLRDTTYDYMNFYDDFRKVHSNLKSGDTIVDKSHVY